MRKVVQLPQRIMDAVGILSIGYSCQPAQDCSLGGALVSRLEHLGVRRVDKPLRMFHELLLKSSSLDTLKCRCVVRIFPYRNVPIHGKRAHITCHKLITGARLAKIVFENFHLAILVKVTHEIREVPCVSSSTTPEV